MTYRILVTDNVEPAGIRKYAGRTDLQFDVKNKLSDAELKKILPDYHALIVRSSTQVTAEVLEAGTNLKVVGRAGVGVDNIQIEPATRRGVLVMNTPEGNITSAAEHAIALMFALARKVASADESMRRGEWEKSKFTGMELHGKTLGLIGMGKVGKIVARVAKAVGMMVLVYDPYISAWLAEKAGVELTTSLQKIMSEADVISIHTPLNETTRGLIGAEALTSAKEGLLIVNAARGGILDEAALLAALDAGKVGGAALDVFAKEPLPADSPLRTHPRIITTPHLGASTVDAQLRVAVDIVDQIVDYLTTNKVVNSVNMHPLTPQHFREISPFMRLTEIIGSMHRQLLQENPGKITLDLYGLPAEHDAVITPSLLIGLLQGLCSTTVNLINSQTFAKEHGLEWSTVKHGLGGEYRNLVQVTVASKSESLVIAGTVSENGVARIVRVGDVRLEAEPYRYMLVMRNQDVPGIIGTVGTILGNAQINIAEWRLGRKDSKAFSLISVDGDVDTNVTQTISRNPAIEMVKLLELPV